MEGVGKMEMNNVLMWHFFDLQIFCVLCATCPSSGSKLEKTEEF